MKTQKHSRLVATVSTSVALRNGFTLGLDLWDRKHQVCVLNAAGEIVREGALLNTPPALTKLLTDYPQATVALEAGTHSPWVSRFLTEARAQVIVANPRKLHAISRHERKCDRRGVDDNGTPFARGDVEEAEVGLLVRAVQADDQVIGSCSQVVVFLAGLPLT